MIAAYVFTLLAALLALAFIIPHVNEDPIALAGRRGEEVATDIISTVLDEKDILLTNVSLSYEGHRTEIDNVIINERGIYLIEVKNYVGHLEGSEKDKEWKKYKITPSGEVYSKPVKNPIRQVDRQVEIVTGILAQKHIDAWVKGYVILLHNNSPVEMDTVLKNAQEIDFAIHRQSDKWLFSADMETAIKLLDRKKGRD